MTTYHLPTMPLGSPGPPAWSRATTNAKTVCGQELDYYEHTIGFIGKGCNCQRCIDLDALHDLAGTAL